jgi:hypothetical protein
MNQGMPEVAFHHHGLRLRSGIRLAHDPLELSRQYRREPFGISQVSPIFEQRGTDQELDSARIRHARNEEVKRFPFPIHDGRLNDDAVEQILFQRFVESRILGPVVEQDREGADHRLNGRIGIGLVKPAAYRSFSTSLMKDSKSSAGDLITRSGLVVNLGI